MNISANVINTRFKRGRKLILTKSKPGPEKRKKVENMNMAMDSILPATLVTTTNSKEITNTDSGLPPAVNTVTAVSIINQNASLTSDSSFVDLEILGDNAIGDLQSPLKFTNSTML